MQQINIFSFEPKIADWKEAPWSTEHMCEVLALIPEDILSPIERKKYRPGSNEWNAQQNLWSTYVTAISTAIPYSARSKNDVNGWCAACDLLKVHRGNKQPVKLKIHERQKDNFLDTEIVEYLI